MKKALIKASFFIDTEVFQHVSQWEKAMMDFYAAHGAELERINVLGAGDGNLFYTIKRMEIMPEVPQPSKEQGLSKKLQEVKSKVNPSLKKNTKPLVRIVEKARPKRVFNAGKTLIGKVGKLTMAKLAPQGT